MQSRFMKGSVNPTILCLASSKRTEQSYMETFIESKKNNESKTKPESNNKFNNYSRRR